VVASRATFSLPKRLEVILEIRWISGSLQSWFEMDWSSLVRGGPGGSGWCFSSEAGRSLGSTFSPLVVLISSTMISKEAHSLEMVDSMVLSLLVNLYERRGLGEGDLTETMLRKCLDGKLVYRVQRINEAYI
jgi:hypothetical protein